MRGEDEDEDHEYEDEEDEDHEDEDQEIQNQNQDHQNKEDQDQEDGNGKNGEEMKTHNVNDLLKGETEGEVDCFTVVEHRTLQAVNDVTFLILTTII